MQKLRCKVVLGFYGKLSLEQVVLGIISFSMESENHLPTFCLYEKQIHEDIPKNSLLLGKHYNTVFLFYSSGVTRGSGWQHAGAYINLGAYYLAGIPVALVLSFVLHLGGKGLWTGLIIGSIMQFVLLFLLTSFTNWQQQVTFYKFPSLIYKVVLD